MLHNFARLHTVFGKHYDIVEESILHDRVPVFTVNQETEFINILMKFFMIPTTKNASPQYDEERTKDLVENAPNIIAIAVTDKGTFPIIRSEVPFGVGPENHIICKTDAGREFALMNSDILTLTDKKVKMKHI